jgi:hypothetical protein
MDEINARFNTTGRHVMNTWILLQCHNYFALARSSEFPVVQTCLSVMASYDCGYTMTSFVTLFAVRQHNDYVLEVTEGGVEDIDRFCPMNR